MNSKQIDAHELLASVDKSIRNCLFKYFNEPKRYNINHRISILKYNLLPYKKTMNFRR